jgi:hypothetical protein
MTGSGQRAQPASEQIVGQVQRACIRATVPEDDREQLVVAQRGRPQALQLFPRPVVNRYGLQDYMVLRDILQSRCAACQSCS